MACPRPERLSEHFWLREFERSASRPDLAAPVPPELLPNVQRLVQTVAQPLRSYWKRPFVVLSGYRSPTLNRAIGGSRTSQHVYAQAMDFTTPGYLDLFRDLVAGKIVVPSGQVIVYPSSAFIHVATPTAKYPRSTFFVHWPEKEYRYVRVSSLTMANLYLPKEN